VNDTQKRDEWVKFVNASSVTYKPWALEAVLANDGIKMLAMVLKVLKLEETSDLIQLISRDRR